MKQVLVIIFCISIINKGCSQKAALQTTQPKKVLTELTFEDPKALHKWEKEVTRSNSFSISDSVARKGKYSGRFELKMHDSLLYLGKRAEIHLSNETEDERWYGFSTFFPKSFVSDPGGECVAQWHDTPDFDLGETWRSPPLGLDIFDDKFKVVVMWAANPVNSNSTISGRKDFDLTTVDKGKWTDWVFHIKWSWQEDGILEVWKNKQKVLGYYGPNSYNDKKFPYFKAGIYKWSWNTEAGRQKTKTDKRVVFFDEIRIGDKTADLEAVSPK